MRKEKGKHHTLPSRPAVKGGQGERAHRPSTGFLPGTSQPHPGPVTRRLEVTRGLPPALAPPHQPPVLLLGIDLLQQWEPEHILSLAPGEAESPRKTRQTVIYGHFHPASKLPHSTGEGAAVRLVGPARLSRRNDLPCTGKGKGDHETEVTQRLRAVTPSVTALGQPTGPCGLQRI